MGQLLEALKGIAIPSSAEQVVREADVAYSKRAETASYIDHLEVKIKNLEAELEQLRADKGIPKEGGGLEFDSHKGIYHESSTGLNYCPKCLADKKRSPLKVERHGWQCGVCGSWYGNPDNPPRVISRGPRGPKGWMGA